MRSEAQLCDMHNIHLNAQGEITASLEYMIHFNPPCQANEFTSLRGFVLENWPPSQRWEVQDTPHLHPDSVSRTEKGRSNHRQKAAGGKGAAQGRTVQRGQERDAFPAEAASWRSSFFRHESLMFRS